MSNKADIVSALFALQQVVEDAETTLGIHVPQSDDPDEIASSKSDGWKKDYGRKMRPVLLAIKQLQALAEREKL